jgi:tetratricopeptide (TPR) repeat protein
LRDQAAGFRVLHAVCEAYTASTPYAVWRELLRELMDFGRDDPDEAVAQRLRDVVANDMPHLVPWLPLIAIAFGLEFAPTAEVEMLAEKNRRPKLHEAVGEFLALIFPGPGLIAIENAHHIDMASAELLSYLAGVVSGRPWIFGVARRPSAAAFTAPAAVRIELAPLTAGDMLRMAQRGAEHQPLPMHVLEVVAKRSGGNPQFLRDLLRAAIQSGGIGGLPESAEAATMARIDALAPEDRALVRRAAVFGLTFHPRMLSWLDEEGAGAHRNAGTWARLGDLFEEEPDGYLRFGRSLLRDAAYEGLPYKLRRRLHGAVAARLEAETDTPEDAAGILSLHYFEACEYRPAWRYASVAARRAHEVYAYVEAAELYSRALDAARRLSDISNKDLATVQEALGDSWNRAGEFDKASNAYGAARRLVGADLLAEAALLLKRSRLEEKLGKYPQALRWAARARKALAGLTGPDAALQAARSSSWYATVLQAQGRNADAIRWADKAIAEAEAVDDPDALGAGYFVKGWAYAALGKEGWEPLVQRSLAAYQRSGDRVKQAVILSNVGVVCQGEGRWDEAMDYYERSREACLKIGDVFGAAVARINVAEILADRGELAEAETILLESLQLWRASKYRYFLGYCLSLLGRVALRAGRMDEALGRFEEAKANFVHVGAEQDALASEARIAECNVFLGNADAALELADRALARARSTNAVAAVAPLLERVRGEALLQRGDVDGARSAFKASLAAGRTRHDRFEVALALLALIRLDQLEGAEPSPEVVGESRSLLASLKVRSVPNAPSFAQPMVT